MAVTNEKMEKVLNYLSDENNANALMELELSEALAKLKAEGIEVTADELKECFENATAEGELSADALEDVAGGCGICEAAGRFIGRLLRKWF